MQIPIFPVLRSDFCPYLGIPPFFPLSYFTKIAWAIAPGLLSGPHGNKRHGFKDFGFMVLFIEN
jgi:hypothetical protein